MGAEFIWRKLGEHGSRHAEFCSRAKIRPSENSLTKVGAQWIRH